MNCKKEVDMFVKINSFPLEVKSERFKIHHYYSRTYFYVHHMDNRVENSVELKKGLWFVE